MNTCSLARHGQLHPLAITLLSFVTTVALIFSHPGSGAI